MTIKCCYKLSALLKCNSEKAVSVKDAIVKYFISRLPEIVYCNVYPYSVIFYGYITRPRLWYLIVVISHYFYYYAVDLKNSQTPCFFN